MPTILAPIGSTGTVATIRITLDPDFAYVESGLGARLTANLLREIADEIDSTDA